MYNQITVNELSWWHTICAVSMATAFCTFSIEWAELATHIVFALIKISLLSYTKVGLFGIFGRLIAVCNEVLLATDNWKLKIRYISTLHSCIDTPQPCHISIVNIFLPPNCTIFLKNLKFSIPFQSIRKIFRSHILNEPCSERQYEFFLLAIAVQSSSLQMGNSITEISLLNCTCNWLLVFIMFNWLFTFFIRIKN